MHFHCIQYVLYHYVSEFGQVAYIIWLDIIQKIVPHKYDDKMVALLLVAYRVVDILYVFFMI